MDNPPTFLHFCSAVYGIWSDTVTGRRSASFIILAAVLAVVNVIFAANLDKALWLKFIIAVIPPLLLFSAALIYAVFYLWREQNIKILALTTKLTPTLELDFDQNSDGIVLTPIKILAIGQSGHQTIIDSNGSYVRIRLTALSETTVKTCSAFITRIEKRNTSSGSFSAIRMPHSQ